MRKIKGIVGNNPHNTLLGSATRINEKIVEITTEYAPPEVYIDNTAKPYIDVFTLGMTMYVLLTRNLDRPDLQEVNDAYNCLQVGNYSCVKAKVDEARRNLSAWDPQVPDEVKQLLKSMLSPNPLSRPTAKEVSNYLSKII